MEQIDYREWLPQLTTTTLFRDIAQEPLVALLDVMRPRVIHLEIGDLYPPEFTPGYFLMFLKGATTKEPVSRRFRWAMPKQGEPGMLMGEIPTLSSFREGLGPGELFTFFRKPRTEPCDLLELSADMLVGDYDASVRPAQNTMLRNLLGILAQKVMDVRQDLFKAKFGVDIYDMQPGDSDTLTKGLRGPHS